MPKIYVAEPSDTPGVDGEGTQRPAVKPVASGSMTTMKERLRAFPDSEWTIKTIQIKADVPTICSLIEDWSKMQPEFTESVRVNASGQVRAAK